MKKYIFLLIISVFLFASCTEYQKLLKSTDNELKYDKAVDYYQAKQYAKAITLFDDIKNHFRGSERSELILNYLAGAYMGQRDYLSASEYYKTYVKSYPRGRFIEEAKYNIAYAYYKDSPDVKLDQAPTFDAIRAFQEFIDAYPQSAKAAEAAKLQTELKDKLSYKDYLNAKLYYNMGMYLGNNNYRAAVITAENALKKNPGTIWKEDLMGLILQSKYAEATVTNYDKRSERYQNVIDEYYNYMNEFPQGRFIKDAERIFKDSQRYVQK